VVVVVPVHTPAPLHTDAVVAMPAEHIAPVHTTDAPGYVHAVRNATLQVPRQVVPRQAGRVPRGVPLTATH
jgi:hypothetical protein